MQFFLLLVIFRALRMLFPSFSAGVGVSRLPPDIPHRPGVQFKIGMPCKWHAMGLWAHEGCRPLILADPSFPEIFFDPVLRSDGGAFFFSFSGNQKKILLAAVVSVVLEFPRFFSFSLFFLFFFSFILFVYQMRSLLPLMRRKSENMGINAEEMAINAALIGINAEEIGCREIEDFIKKRRFYPNFTSILPLKNN